ncbi:apg12-domain-containing protein [Phaffia rhodozyma]|uniref:Ubiquitin-like protein ATG12 n=1 Tax=Phaffia rhodozyma TaxID=264483 RepID=A0A0F7SG94_PHARH|nr:apg12-domain-containing protein [Phaffia rhodozyma]
MSSFPDTSQRSLLSPSPTPWSIPTASSPLPGAQAGAPDGTPGRIALEEYKKRDGSKVVVRFKAVGSAPIMKQNFYKITGSNRFQAVIQFLRKELNWKPNDPLFTYINSSFSPAPDDTVSNLFKCFSTEGHLIVNYSLNWS